MSKENGSSDRAFTDSLGEMSLSELQDVFGHLDRDRYPERIEAVRQEMQSRIEALGDYRTGEDAGDEAAGAGRRLWGSILDVFVSLFPLVLYTGIQMLAASSGGGGRGGGRGRGGRGGPPQEEESVFDQVVAYLTSPEAIWDTVATYGPYVLAFIAYRAIFVIPQLAKSGWLPGMKEAGLRVVSKSGTNVTVRQAGIRFLSAYVLGFLTLGIGHLSALWDRGGRALHDRLAATRVVRVQRRWEMPAEQRLFED